MAKQKRPHSFVVRFSDIERQVLEDYATQQGMSSAEVIRDFVKSLQKSLKKDVPESDQDKSELTMQSA